MKNKSIEYFIHFWGGAEETIAKELGLIENYYWFKTEEERIKFMNQLSKFKHLGLSWDLKDGIMTHKETKVKITCLYNDTFYNFIYNFGYEYSKEAAIYMFKEGNYACDCNLSIFIQKYCNSDFPELDCGDEIEILNIEFIE